MPHVVACGMFYLSLVSSSVLRLSDSYFTECIKSRALHTQSRIYASVEVNMNCCDSLGDSTQREESHPFDYDTGCNIIIRRGKVDHLSIK